MYRFYGTSECPLSPTGHLRLLEWTGDVGMDDVRVGDAFVLTRADAPCVLFCPLDAWERLEGDLWSFSRTPSDERNRLRTMLRWAEEVVVDEAYRVQVPMQLAAYAELDRRALAVGRGDHLEIWDPSRRAVERSLA